MRASIWMVAACLFASSIASSIASPALAQQVTPNPHTGHLINAPGIGPKSGNQSELNPGTGVATPSTNGILYHNGPVMLGTTHIYYIWYGNWSTDASANAILTNFANNIGGSPYFNINTTYTDSNNNAVSNSVTLAGSINDTSTKTSLADADIWSTVTRAFTNGLPVDANGVYFVLTAPGVSETSGFLTQYCGWHYFSTYNGTTIKYAFVGNAKGSSLWACAAQTSQSPNGDPAADGMVSVVAHELQETVSDPQISAWYDSNGQENADKCAWTFGTTYTAANGSSANMKLGSMDYLIQRNWLNSNGGSCQLSYSTNANDYSLAVTPASQTVQRGGTSSNYTIAVTKTGTFNSAVSFQVSGLPSGATLATSPSASASSATFSISVASTVATGSYPLTITGTSGSLSHTASATLVVTAPDFSLAVTPASQTVAPGSTTGNYAIAVTAAGTFSSSVSFKVTGLPTGATLATSPSASATAATFSISAASTLAAGTYTLTITGTSGSLSHTASATLVVTAPDFSLAVTPASQTVASGSVTGNYAIAVSATGAFNSAVSFKVTGLPTGATLATSPATLPAGSGAKSASFTVGTASVAPGTYTLTITGTSGSLSHTASASLVVTAPDFSLAITPASQTATVGSTTGNYAIAVTATGTLSSAVSFKVTGLPTGATLATSPAPVTVTSAGASAAFSVNLAASVTPGTYPLTITGTSGSLSHTASAALIVSAQDFGLTLSPATQSVMAGSVASYGITVNKLGTFSSVVTFQVAGLPTGVTIQSAPSASATSASFSIHVPSSTLAGTYPFTVTGTSGSLTHKVSASLAVTPPDFALAVSPASQTVVQGSATGNYSIGVTGSPVSAVNFKVTGLPSGAVLQIAPTASSTSSFFTVYAAANVPPGTYPLTVTGAAGTLTHTTSATLVVTAPDFSLAVTAPAQSVSQGSVSGTFGIAITKTATLAVPVSFQITGLPTGVTVQSSPSATQVASSFTVNVASTVAAGTYHFNVIGNSGSLSHSTTASLVVVAASAPPFTISLSPITSSVTAGGAARYSLTITPAANLKTGIGLTILGLPGGVQVSIGAGAPGAAVTMTITTAGNTPKGTYPFTITGNTGQYTGPAVPGTLTVQ